MPLRTAVIGVLFATILAGCTSPQVQLIGRFELSPTSAPPGNTRLERLARELTANSTLEFRPDNVCIISLESRTIRGHYRIHGHNVTIDVNEVRDMQDVPPFRFLLEDGGKTLTGTMFGAGERFTKV